MKFSKEDLLLYAVTDRSWLGKQSLYEQVALSPQKLKMCFPLHFRG